MKPIVYLAGPIAGATYGAATNWREIADSVLEEACITTLDPMRHKGELCHKTVPIARDFHQYSAHGPFYTAKGIMTRDFTDVKRSDALLVNLYGTEVMTTGTVMELGWAYAMQKPVVVWIESEGNIHDTHPMVNEAIGAFRYEDLFDALDAMMSILGR